MTLITSNVRLHLPLSSKCESGSRSQCTKTQIVHFCLAYFVLLISIKISLFVNGNMSNKIYITIHPIIHLLYLAIYSTVIEILAAISQYINQSMVEDICYQLSLYGPVPP